LLDCLIEPPKDNRPLLISQVAPCQLVAVNPNQHFIKVTKFTLNNLKRQTMLLRQLIAVMSINENELPIATPNH